MTRSFRFNSINVWMFVWSIFFLSLSHFVCNHQKPLDRYWIHSMRYATESAPMRFVWAIWKTHAKTIRASWLSVRMWKFSSHFGFSFIAWKSCFERTHIIDFWLHPVVIIWFRWLMKFHTYRRHRQCYHKWTISRRSNFVMVTIGRQTVDWTACAHTPWIYR